MSLIADQPKKSDFARPRDNFLNSHIFISAPVMRLLRTGADLAGFPSADTYANHLLIGALDAVPGLASLEARIARVTQEAKAELLQLHPVGRPEGSGQPQGEGAEQQTETNTP